MGHGSRRVPHCPGGWALVRVLSQGGCLTWGPRPNIAGCLGLPGDPAAGEGCPHQLPEPPS